MKEFNLYLSSTSGNKANCLYPDVVEVRSIKDMKKAIQKDHVCAKFKRSYRSNDNFVTSNVIALDCDNEDDDEKSWVDPVEIAQALPNVCFYAVYSKSHNKQKGNKGPRPRFHIYFPIDEITDAKEYAKLKQEIVNAFPIFDKNALDPARFLFGGVGEIEVYEGDKTIADYLKGQIDEFEKFDEESFEIKQGSRNSSMSHFAGKILKRLGNSDEAYKAYLDKAQQCNPPLSKEELDGIWNSALKFSKKVSNQEGYITPDLYNTIYTLKPEHLTDVGQATVLAKEYEGRLAYTPATDYMVYNGSFFEESKEKAQGLSQELTIKQIEEAKNQMDIAMEELKNNGGLKLILTLGTKKAKEQGSPAQKRSIEKLEDAKEYEKYAIKRQDSKSIAATLKEAKPILSSLPSEFDKNEFLLNTPSFTYDLQKGVNGALKHDPLNKITKQTFCDPTVEGKNIWLDALDTFFEGDKELIEYVQTIVGLSAIGKVYMEALIIAYGEGKNGKSTFWNAISKVLGTYSGNISADMLTAACRRNVKPELAEAKGKRMLIASELQEGMRLNTSNVKQLCSTDDIYAEKKYKDPFSYTPSHTLVLYTNHLPKVGAIDKGTWRRLIIIPFNAELSGKKEIKNYTDYLVKNAGGYILYWIIEGAKKAIDKGFKIDLPKKVEEAVEQYKDDNDWFSLFISECCEIDPTYVCKSGELYQEYRAFCIRSAEFIKSTTEFYSALTSNGYKRKKNKKGSFIYGLRLKSDFLQE